MSNSRWVHIHVERIDRITEKAMLLLLDDDEAVWIPLSQISDPDNYDEGDEDVTVSVTEFIAKEKGLEGHSDSPE